MQTCELWKTMAGDDLLVGRITLDGTNIQGTAMAGKINIAKVMAQPHYINGQMVSMDADPVAWFNALTTQYNGTYLRAQMV